MDFLTLVGGMICFRPVAECDNGYPVIRFELFHQIIGCLFHHINAFILHGCGTVYHQADITGGKRVGFRFFRYSVFQEGHKHTALPQLIAMILQKIAFGL